MKITTLNAWGGKLHQALIQYIQTTQPHILCLQEVVHSPQTDIAWLNYQDHDKILPQRANLFSEVSAVLPDHTAIFCPAAQGELWDKDTAVPSLWGLATFVHKSLPITAQAQGFVHGTYSAHDYGEHPRSRNAHAVRVYDYEKDRAVVVAHMHGLRDLRGKMDTPERVAQAKRLKELVQGVAEPGDPIVVCGDFNVEPQSQTFAVLAEIDLTDLVTGSGFDGTRTSHYAKPGKYADYMLVNKAVDVLSFDVVREPEVSDHCALVVEV